MRTAGIENGDILLIHSSLKSFGNVIGGAPAVINAAMEVIGEDGTLVFPTLVQKDFRNAYKNWNVETTPSDVGFITETFRKTEGVMRSDQATHSVAAIGKLAVYLTSEHTAYGPRMGVFGDYAFSHSSPWQRMYFEGAKILFIGVNTVYNTFKHFVEYRFVEYLLNSIKDERKRSAAMSELAVFGRSDWPGGIWPFHDSGKTEIYLEEHGMIKHSVCGNSNFICIKANEYVDAVTELFKTEPENWLNLEVNDFIIKYKNK